MDDSKESEISITSPSLSHPTRWWSKNTVAIVTGANKGIGFALVKRLAKMGLSVILTARDLKRGSMAVEELRSQGLLVYFFKLDVSDPASIFAFVAWFKDHFGALDILVNNAGVSFNEINENTVEHAETVMKTNFYGAKLLTEAMLPMFRRCSQTTSRILNITSRLGTLNKVRNSGVKEILESENVGEKEIEGVVRKFMEDVKSGRWVSEGWPELWTDYAVSKLALNAYTRLLSKRYQGKGLSVNCFCPGFTQTSMTRGKGTHSADDAALFAANLALLPPHHLPTGKFFLMPTTTTTSTAAAADHHHVLLNCSKL
ncbi:hypothetical protein FNV43_RR07150 [Rhamnella rubrinervis]|uniref:(+)-neomenthol dehydrogenase n=1 Tax=Rhamnella rubrinervis TaxID=2594499 RepID=A0A8K0HER2_9ROSA|nr:hypothetical protein FNV43_RR07150 [Rhamnella rubrinervis]